MAIAAFETTFEIQKSGSPYWQVFEIKYHQADKPSLLINMEKASGQVTLNDGKAEKIVVRRERHKKGGLGLLSTELELTGAEAVCT